MSSIFAESRFYVSADIHLPVKVFISSISLASASTLLELASPPCPPTALPSHDPADWYVSVRVVSNGIASPGCASTQHSYVQGETLWIEEWLTLPVHFSELTRTSRLVLSVHGVGGVVLGGVELPLFDERLQLRRGMQKLLIWPHVSRREKKTTMSTPSRDGLRAAEAAGTYLSTVPDPSTDDSLAVDKAMERFDVGDIPRVTWLDRLSLRQLEILRRGATVPLGVDDSATVPEVGDGEEDSIGGKSHISIAPVHPSSTTASPPFLTINLPYFDFPVLFEDSVYDSYTGHIDVVDADTTGAERADVAAVRVERTESKKGGGGGGESEGEEGGHVVAHVKTGEDWSWRWGTVHDPEAMMENPTDIKYARLARGLLRGVTDPSLKPNRVELARIKDIMAMPGERLPPDGEELLWKFRFYLTANKRAVVKFLQCVDWSDEDEATQAGELLDRWAPIGSDDALRLLGPDTAFARPVVRQFAVRALERAEDDELIYYLLQLVQALRYESQHIVERHPDDDPALAAEKIAIATSVIDEAGVEGPRKRGGGEEETGDDEEEREEDDDVTPSLVAQHALEVAAASASAATGRSNTVPSAAAIAAAVAEGDEDGDGSSAEKEEDAKTLGPLAEFLLSRASKSLDIANWLRWYFNVETEDPKFGATYRFLLQELFDRLRVSSPKVLADLQAQEAFVNGVLGAARKALEEGRIDAKVATLAKELSAGGLYGAAESLSPPVALPLDPKIRLAGIKAKECRVFQSSVYPVFTRIVVDESSSPEGWWNSSTMRFKVLDAQRSTRHHDRMTADLPPRGGAAAGGGRDRGERGGSEVPQDFVDIGEELGGGGGGGGEEEDEEEDEERDSRAAAVAAAVSAATRGDVAVVDGKLKPRSWDVIFKIGDDMRQDQLILQLVELMDSQLKRVNLNLELTTYRVLALSATTGVMECVPAAQALDPIKSNIMGWFRDFPENQDPSAPFGVRRDVMQNYVKSCAGYCVITYLLGVGDRHFHNILIRRTGHLFHVDFGFVLGKDPKPYPPPIKLTRQMINGMGGVRSDYYRDFLDFTAQAFLVIRRSANLFLSLLSLMKDANIPDMQPSPDEAVEFVRKKFLLELDDEGAERAFLRVLDDSVAALFPLLSDYIHSIATKMR